MSMFALRHMGQSGTGYIDASGVEQPSITATAVFASATAALQAYGLLIAPKVSEYAIVNVVQGSFVPVSQA